MGPAMTLGRRFGAPPVLRPVAGHRFLSIRAQSAPGPEQQTRPSPPLWLRRALAAAGVAAAAAAAAAATLAAAPWALSHPAGLRAALAAANKVAPFAVEIDTVQAGWHRPLDVRGLRLRQREPKAPQHAQHDSNEERPLVEVQRVRTSAKLWQLATGKPSDVVVRGVAVDLTTAAPSGAPALLQTLQDAGMSPRPRGQPISRPPPALVAAHEESRSGDPVSPPVAASAAPAMAVPFSAEIRARGLHVAVSQGSVLAPAEIADALGAGDNGDGGPEPNTHVEVLLGAETIEEESLEQEAAAGFTSAGEEGGMGGESSSIAEWARHRPSVSLPPDVGPLTGPVAIRLDSPAAKATLAGWRTAKGYIYLASPVQAELNLTPGMARLLLRRLNPLLGDAVGLRGNARVAAWASPAEGLWPTSAAEIRVEPLRLRVGRGAGLGRALEVLRIVNARVAAAADAAELAVDTTPLRAELRADGTIVAHRLDLSVGISGLPAPLRLVSWGTAAASAAGPVSMTLAVPAESLALVGIAGLPPDFAVPLPVRGTVAAPRVDVIAAGKEVALLLVEAKARKAGPRGAEWLWQELRLGGGTSRERFKIPEE